MSGPADCRTGTTIPIWKTNARKKMIKKTYYILVFIFLYTTVVAQTPGDEDKEMFNRGKQRDQQAIDEAVNGWWTASMKNHDQRVQWWREAKFGMFIHWGIYSLPGGEWKQKKVSGYAEHLMRKEKITRAEYLELAHRFNPVNFNADKWAADAKRAGMKYLIITSKHHDGFAMYDSKVSDFNIMQQSAFKRDPMAELSAACKKQGIKFGFYYSHAFDWEHPDAPGNDWEYNNPGGDKNLFGGANWFNEHPELLPKAIKYVNEKSIPQIIELIRKYHPDILWFDTPGKLPLSENIRIMKAIRAVDSNVVINGRLARSGEISFGDYKNTADRPAEFYPVTGDWEAIPTTNESYGYSKYDDSHKPVSFFVQLLAKAAAGGGNLLMNIGPKGDGTFDQKDISILYGIGQWMDKNGESIYNTTAATLAKQSWGVSTQKENKLYLHVFDWPKNGKLYVGGLKSKVGRIYFLADKTKKPLSSTTLHNAVMYINVPKTAPDSINTVIVMEVKQPVQADTVRYVYNNCSVARLLAFDATQYGRGFRFGDGKANNYVVESWKPGNFLQWQFNTIAPAKYKLIIKYIGGEDFGGSYQLQLDDAAFNSEVGGEKNVTKDFGTVTLKEGLHVLTVKPVSIGKKDLMRLLEVQLVPVE